MLPPPCFSVRMVFSKWLKHPHNSEYLCMLQVTLTLQILYFEILLKILFIYLFLQSMWIHNCQYTWHVFWSWMLQTQGEHAKLHTDIINWYNKPWWSCDKYTSFLIRALLLFFLYILIPWYWETVSRLSHHKPKMNSDKLTQVKYIDNKTVFDSNTYRVKTVPTFSSRLPAIVHLREKKIFRETIIIKQGSWEIRVSSAHRRLIFISHPYY